MSGRRTAKYVAPYLRNIVLITVYEEGGNHHFNRKPHLVFVLAGADSHGLTRIQPEYYTCNECGTDLSPAALDRGDEAKKSWPDCKSWRNDGQKRCPECGTRPSIGRSQHIRARGYEPTPKDEIKQITSAQREEGLDRTDGDCLICDDSAEYVIRMVPPRYGGNRDISNLAPLCEHHYDDFGHMFADILEPAEWHKIQGVEWNDIAPEVKEQVEAMGIDQLADILDQMIEEVEDPTDPFIYLRPGPRPDSE